MLCIITWQTFRLFFGLGADIQPTHRDKHVHERQPNCERDADGDSQEKPLRCILFCKLKRSGSSSEKGITTLHVSACI